MAKARKDFRGRALKKGEVQRKSDQRYMYTYTDPLGRRKFIYANDLTELREKELELQKKSAGWFRFIYSWQGNSQ